MIGSRGAGKSLYPWILGSGVKKMEIWKKESLCLFHMDDLEFEMYMLEEEGDDNPSAVWMKITRLMEDGKAESLEFPVQPENINHLVAGIKQARLIIKDQWSKKEKEEEPEEDDDDDDNTYGKGWNPLTGVPPKTGYSWTNKTKPRKKP